jgi:hypothetical protein
MADLLCTNGSASCTIINETLVSTDGKLANPNAGLAVVWLDDISDHKWRLFYQDQQNTVNQISPAFGVETLASNVSAGTPIAAYYANVDTEYSVFVVDLSYRLAQIKWTNSTGLQHRKSAPSPSLYYLIPM